MWDPVALGLEQNHWGRENRSWENHNCKRQGYALVPVPLSRYYREEKSLDTGFRRGFRKEFEQVYFYCGQTTPLQKPFYYSLLLAELVSANFTLTGPRLHPRTNMEKNKGKGLIVPYLSVPMIRLEGLT